MKKLTRLLVLCVLILSFLSLSLAQAEIIPARGMGQIGYSAVVLCESLTVRAKPDASSKAVKTLPYGKTFMVTHLENGWAECMLSDDVNASPAGWVNTDYVIIDPAWYRAEEKTNVYAWNDLNAPKIALIDANTTLPVLKDDGEWLIVSLRGATGYVNVQNRAGQTAYQAEPAGERFEAVITIEGMEETVNYEHFKNESLGIEMDYEYEMFMRAGYSDREYFVSVYDDPQNPVDCFEIVRAEGDAEDVAAAITEALSRDYEVYTDTRALERAGECIYLDASANKGGLTMPDVLKSVYVIPAAEGCYVVNISYWIESAEGLGRRISCMLNTLSLIDVGE